MTPGPKPRNGKKTTAGQSGPLLFDIISKPLREAHAVSKDPERMRREDGLLRKLDSKDEDLRCEALTTLVRHGGPGAIRILAEILDIEGRHSDKEKLLALEAIDGIVKRTGMYYDGILVLERTCNEGSHSNTVTKRARHVRNSICGERIINTFPGSKIDDRILI